MSGLSPEDPAITEEEFRRQCLEFAGAQLFAFFEEMSDAKYGWVYSSAERERLRDVVCTAIVRALRDGTVLHVHEGDVAALDVRETLAHLAKSLPKKPN